MKRKMMNLAAMALSALLCFATTAAATQPETTWYVDVSATGGDGKTPETAFKTLNDALTNSGLQEGNTIMIASGEYKGTDNTGIEISKNLNFIKYGDDEAIFDAENQRRIWTVKATSINITGLTFKNGKVDKGGAIYFANKLNNFNINATFTNNTASSSGGGAIHFEEDYEYTGNINGIFVNNTASSSGAAINVVRGSFAGNINGSFVNNKASYGGAVYIDQDFTGNIAGIFINNKGNSGGGAIELEHGTMSGNITGIFINNTADNGGAIYTDESDTDGLLIRDSIFINNKDNIAGSDYSEYNVFVKNSWFGNNANNYNTAPIVGDGVIMSDWLFLNATADPAELNVNGTSTITFKLDSYNDKTLLIQYS